MTHTSHRPHFARRTLASVVTIAIAASLAGCSWPWESPNPQSVAFVVGVRSNSALPEPRTLWHSVLGDAEELAAGSSLTVTGISGGRAGIDGASVAIPDTNSPRERKVAAANAYADVVNSMKSIRPDSPEADVLGAVAAATNKLTGEPENQTLVIADSLLSTAGVLQLQTPQALTADVATTIDQIPEDELPTLEGVAVVLIVSPTVSPQEDLGIQDRTKITQIWVALLERAGARTVTVVTGAGNDTTPGLPTVTAVTPTAASTIRYTDCRAVVPSDRVEFEPDSADFVDVDLALAAFAEISLHLQGCEGTVTITGTSANADSMTAQIANSHDRAEAANSLLAPLLGLDPNDATITGVGSNFPDHVEEYDASGQWDDNLAGLNRTIIISFSTNE